MNSQSMDLLTFDVKFTDASCPLSLLIKVNGQTQQTVVPATEPVMIEIPLQDAVDRQQHHVEFVMLGKLPEHTKLDPLGNFVTDPLIIVNNFQLNQIPCDAAVWKSAVYAHDCNGSTAWEEHEFSGVMGCNGCVTFTIETPFLMWLLDNT